MNKTFNIGDKVKVVRRGERSSFTEVGRGVVMGLSDGKNVQFIHYTDRDWPIGVTELICVSAPCVKVEKW